MKQLFKAGDKVTLMEHSMFGWETEERSIVDNLEVGVTYTVELINSESGEDYSNYDNWDITINGCYFHPNHFKHAKLSNEQRIAKRQEELRNE